MTDLPHPLPTTVVEVCDCTKYEVHRFIEEKQKYDEKLGYSVGSSYTSPHIHILEDSLIVAKVAKAFVDEGVRSDIPLDIHLS